MTQPVPTNPMQASSKPELRRMLRQRLATLDPAVRHAQSVLAADRVVATPEWQRAQTVMLFLPLPDEIETAPLAYRAWQAGKTVVVPSISDPQQRRMIPVQITSLAQEALKQAHYGVREPSAVKPVPVETINFALVPGLGFSRRGERIGRGLGYYDRFLAQETFSGITCGLAFSVQVLDALPADDRDQPVDLLATELELLRFGGGLVG